MKEYDRYVVWLDYFDSALKRREGRRVPLSSATRSPTVQELSDACERLGLKPSPQVARHPRSQGRESGYVAIAKAGPKRSLILKIARELAHVRGMAPKKPSPQPGNRKK
jgi:signal recognition particle subunit SRP19